MDYNLAGLSTRSFEQLIQAIAAKLLGPNIVVFGDGRDGGREATFEGTIPFPTKGSRWSGYGVVQAKFKQRLQDTQTDGDWALQQLRAELEDFADPEKARRKPDYYVFATNVVLTPFREKGSKDKAYNLFRKFESEVPLKDFAIWDYDSIRVFLDDNEAIRQAYAAWITPGDVLAEVMKWVKPSSSAFEQVLTRYLQEELLSDQYSNLEKARHASDNPIPIARVFVDLPVFDRQMIEPPEETSDDLPSGFISEILDVAAQRLDPKSSALSSVGAEGEIPTLPESGRFVLIGGPGQGKSTVGQFACQLFRASILMERQESLDIEVRQALKVILSQCESEKFGLPTSRRFPIRIELNSFAKELASKEAGQVDSVLTYIVERIRKKTNREVSVEDFRRWLSAYPWMVVLDGLDEVPPSSNRDDILAAIRSFRLEARECNADLLILATTRPQGYSQDFLPSLYRHTWLAPLSTRRAMHYGRRLVEARYKADQERKDKVLDRLRLASLQSATARLMRSPLQVTIMTTLVDRMGQPPQERWDLFRKYYNVIYEREVERGIPAASILREYKTDIDTIHRRVGLLLQVESERTGKTDARFSTDDFGLVVDSRLEERGHYGEEHDRLRHEIMEAAADRLVFLVGVESNQVGFEIRSLQEFMASEALMSGGDDDVRKRLRAIAPIPNWRNVFLFAAGKCSVEREDLLDTIYKICAELNEDQNDQVASATLAGSQLALDLLEDIPIRQQPNDARILARIALRLLDLPPSNNHVRLADLYDPLLESVYRDELTRRLELNDPKQRLGAWACLIRLVDLGVEWSKRMDTLHWPSGPLEQLDLFRVNREVKGKHWIQEKLEKTVPKLPPVELFARSKSTEQKLIPHEESEGPLWIKAVAKFQHEGVRPDLEVALNLSAIDSEIFRLRLVSISNSRNDWLIPLKDLPNPGPGWTAIIGASRFLADPSRKTLAHALREVANDTDPATIKLAGYRSPWPMSACLRTTTDPTELIKLAERVDAGILGDIEDWVSAENRWHESGFTEQDINFMCDERLPFDQEIALRGIPLIGGWSVREGPDLQPLVLRLIELHESLESVFTRQELGRWCLFMLGTLGSTTKTKVPFLTLAQFEYLVEKSNLDQHYLRLDALNMIQFPDNADEDLLSFLDGLGRVRLIYTSRLNENVRGLLSRLFLQNPARVGILRMIGLLIEQGLEVSLPSDVLDTIPLTDSLAKETVIALKLIRNEWKLSETEWMAWHMNELVEDRPELFHRINMIINNLPPGTKTDLLLLELRRHLTASNRETLEAIIVSLNVSLKRRNSQLNSLHLWSALKLPAKLGALLGPQ